MRNFVDLKPRPIRLLGTWLSNICTTMHRRNVVMHPHPQQCQKRTRPAPLVPGTKFVSHIINVIRGALKASIVLILTCVAFVKILRIDTPPIIAGPVVGTPSRTPVKGKPEARAREQTIVTAVGFFTKNQPYGKESTPESSIHY